MKLKKIKRMVAVGTAILMTLSLAGCGIGSDSVKLGAAGVGGGYYAFSNAFAQIASSEDEDLDFEVKARFLHLSARTQVAFPRSPTVQTAAFSTFFPLSVRICAKEYAQTSPNPKKDRVFT